MMGSLLEEKQELIELYRGAAEVGFHALTAIQNLQKSLSEPYSAHEIVDHALKAITEVNEKIIQHWERSEKSSGRLH